MIKAENEGNGKETVYDISLDGTVVNALGMNVVSNTDGFNFQLPDTFRYNEENPYIGLGLNRNVKKGKEYTGFEADVAEFNDQFMRVKMGLGIDEVVNATINFSRKNYADYFPKNPYPDDVKMVGNTIKSKKMPEYISKFLAKGIRMLLQNKGQEFLDEYYSYVEKIYNLQIPLRDIASKGKIKKSIEDYKKDCKTLTKAGTPKSRQAWMELAIVNNVKADLGDTIYYINTGTSKSHTDVKRVRHRYDVGENFEKVEITKEIEKAYRLYKKEEKEKGTPASELMSKDELIAEKFPNSYFEDEIVLNCRMLPAEVVEAEEDMFCDGNFEYNVAKYIEQFNKRITPLLVCFSKDIRDKILITNPDDRPYFTEDESRLCSGQPNNPGDQDTYEQLMTMDDKEIRFWMRHPELDIPFVSECGMDWDEIKGDYLRREEEEKQNGISIVREEYENILENVSKEDIDSIVDEGKLPSGLSRIVELDPVTYNFVCKDYPDTVIGSMRDFFEGNALEKDEY